MESKQHELIQAFKWFNHSPEGNMVLEYLQAMFLYPNKTIADLCNGQVPTNDEQLGHQRVVLHIMAMMDQ